MLKKKHPLSQHGFAHHLLLVAVIVVVGIVGVGSYTAVSSYAATPSAARKHKPPKKVYKVHTNVLYYNYSHKDQYHRARVTYRPGAQNHPWIIMIHGGTWVRGDATSLSPWAAQLASKGYTVFNIDYPLLNPHNEYPNLPQVTQQQQRAAIYDALRWIRVNAKGWGINPNRGAVFGFSAGGQLGLQLGLGGNGAPGIKVIVSASGAVSPERIVAVQRGTVPELKPNPTDQEATNIIEKLAVGCPYDQSKTDAACAASWQAFSPKYLASRGDPPVLLYNGTADPGVPYYSAGEVAAYLRAHGVKAEAHYVTGMKHTPDTALGAKSINYTMKWLNYYTR